MWLCWRGGKAGVNVTSRPPTHQVVYKLKINRFTFLMSLSNLERGRSVTRQFASPYLRALAGTAGAIAGAGTGVAGPFLGAVYKRYRSASRDSARVASSPMRGRSMSRSTSRMRSRSRARSSSRARSGYRSGSLITNQRDYASRYVRSRGNRGAGRRSRRFRYRVMQTVNANQPLSIYTKLGAAAGISAINTQNYYGVGLYTTQQADQPDLKDLLTDAGINIAAAAPNPALSSKVVIKSCCLDVQFRNIGAADLILDIYEILNVRDVDTTAATSVQFDDFFKQMTTITAANSINPAVSIFENPVFCRHYKVLSKKETTIPAGDLVTMQMRYGKDRSITASSVLNYKGALPKLAKFYFFMWHGIPDTAAAQIAATSVSLTWQKSYKYAIMSGRTTAQVHNA